MLHYILIPAKIPGEFDQFKQADQITSVDQEIIFANGRENFQALTKAVVDMFNENKGAGWRKIAEVGVTYLLLKVEIPDDKISLVIQDGLINKNDAATHQLQFLLAAKPQIFKKKAPSKQDEAIKKQTLKRATIKAKTIKAKTIKQAPPAPTTNPPPPPTASSAATVQPANTAEATQPSQPPLDEFATAFAQYRGDATHILYDFLVNEYGWSWEELFEQGKPVINEETGEPYYYVQSPYPENSTEPYKPDELRALTYSRIIGLYSEGSENLEDYKPESKLASNLAIFTVLTMINSPKLMQAMSAYFVATFPNLDLKEQEKVNTKEDGKKVFLNFHLNFSIFKNASLPTLSTFVPSKDKIKSFLLMKVFHPYLKEGITPADLESTAQDIDKLVVDSKLASDEERDQLILERVNLIHQYFENLKLQNQERKLQLK